jgi:hypothetical protein
MNVFERQWTTAGTDKPTAAKKQPDQFDLSFIHK